MSTRRTGWKHRATGIWVVIAIGIIAGCDHPSTPAVPKPTVPAGAGIVRGVVHYQGPPVTPKIIGSECCPGAKPATDESLLVDQAGGLANVVVWIDNGPNIPPAVSNDALLWQENCQYQPHVMAVQTGRRIQIKNHDGTLHNVHYQGEQTAGDNFAEAQNEEGHAVKFESPDTITFKCDVHPWMKAYVRVFDHPCFAVTAGDGSFTLDRLPPGTYKVIAWHEKLGELAGTAVVKDAAPVVLNFDYKP